MYVETEVVERNFKPLWIWEQTPYIWQRSLSIKFACLIKRREVMSRELMQRAYQSMELVVVPTSKLDHGEVGST